MSKEYMNVVCPVCDRWKSVFSFQAAPAVILRVGQIRALNIEIVMELGRNIPPQLFERHVGVVLRGVV